MSRADVDGDGRADQVGLVEYSDGSATTRSVVRVRTASGRRMLRTIDGHWEWSTSWHGAAAIDGRRGHELVLGQLNGAHTLFFTVLTYRDGQLVTLRSPDGRWNWLTDAAYSVSRGWYRSLSGGMRVTSVVSERVADESESSRPHEQTRSIYRWSAGRWVRVSTRTTRVSTAAVMPTAGWHIPYLKQYPTWVDR